MLKRHLGRVGSSARSSPAAVAGQRLEFPYMTNRVREALERENQVVVLVRTTQRSALAFSATCACTPMTRARTRSGSNSQGHVLAAARAARLRRGRTEPRAAPLRTSSWWEGYFCALNRVQAFGLQGAVRGGLPGSGLFVQRHLFRTQRLQTRRLLAIGHRDAEWPTLSLLTRVKRPGCVASYVSLSQRLFEF